MKVPMLESIDFDGKQMKRKKTNNQIQTTERKLTHEEENNQVAKKILTPLSLT